jgi:succinate dehydrogenase/fumarate reductase flavoprotein subunit
VNENRRQPVDLLVAGAGLAGLYAAVRAAQAGARVTLATKGPLRL